MELHLVISVLLLIWVFSSGSVCCQRPVVVNVGTVFTFNSTIGRAAKAAMDAAVFDVNNDRSILNGTELRLIREDIDSNAFSGTIKAFQVLEKEVVAIIGPQSSTVAHMISEIANGLQVPLVSYAATDPTLSALQFPFFLRTTQSDLQQMAAIANLVDFYEWREVIAVYVDDEYGRNGITSLEDELHKRSVKISYKLSLPVQFDSWRITEVLNKSKLYGPRVYVVHVYPDPELKFFNIAQKLKMLTRDYVWLVTDWLSTTFDSFSPINRTSLSIVEGVVGLRQYIPPSRQKKAFASRWNGMQQKGLTRSGLNMYGLRAYDTVWAVAFAVDEYLTEQNRITFSTNVQLQNVAFGKFKVFDGGNILLRKLMQTNFTGLAGQVQFHVDRSLLSSSYEIININHGEFSRAGYWFNNSGLSVSPRQQDKQNTFSRHDQELGAVTWPGGATEKPRGWVIADEGRPLQIVVPNRSSFVEFATESHSSNEMTGYSIEVFNEARKLVPYDVPCRFHPFGNGSFNPNYDQLVKLVADNAFDAAVGDIAIVTNRTKMVDFTQPYVATGLVIVVPISNSTSDAWVFLKPFSMEMWCVTAASFVMIAVVIWILEHRVNDDFRGSPKRQLITMFLFSFSTLFKTNQEDTVSTLGRMVMVVWLFLLLVITSSYTASLTSILTVQQLSVPITGIESLITNDWPIGCQEGSFAYNYLTESLNIPSSRLVPMGSPEAYEIALRKSPSDGGVAAVVDELPYIELFLSTRSDFGIVGQTFTRNGWGFAFPRDSPLALDMSTAILRLSESGKLQEINNKWFCKMGCLGERREAPEPEKLHLRSFWGLYLLCGVCTLTALLIFLVQTLRQFLRFKRKQRDHNSTSPGSSSETRCSKVIYNFWDFVDEKEEAIKKHFTQTETSQPQASHQ